MRKTMVWAWLVVSALAVGCGGSKDSVTARSANGLTDADIDADPIALLPGSAIAVANVDTKAFFTSQTFGSDVSKLAEKYFPIGEEAGFVPSRDVDRVVAATYSTQGLDVAAVIKGRFDEKKIADAADKHTPMKSGGALVASQYAGRTIYTLNNAGFTVMTPNTVIAGTEAGIHRALDRIKDGKKDRAITSWMIDTIETKGAAFGAAGDFASQPVSSVAIGSLNIPWLKGAKAVRLVGQFKDGGTQVAGSLTYDTEDDANAGASGMKQVANLTNIASLVGIVPKLEDLDIHVEKTSVQYKFSVNDQGLRQLAQAIPSLVPPPQSH